MELKPTASYYSARAAIDNAPLRRLPRRNPPASHFSAAADSRTAVRQSVRDIFANAQVLSRRTALAPNSSVGAASLYSDQQTMADNTSIKSFSTKLAADDPSGVNNQKDFFERLRSSLATLSARLLDLNSLETFNPNRATSSAPNAVTITPATLAETAKYFLTVERLAVKHQVASDQSADPFQALGVTGSFSINGYSITVSATDSIADIRDMINIGEDLNKDGKLNTQSEDLNGNGVLDVYFQSAVFIGNGVYIPAFSYAEDRNKDGVIDPSEDTNGNKTIDGGGERIGVKARLQDNRLLLESTGDSGEKLRIDDPNNILENLGFFKRDSQNNKILKSSVDDSVYFKDPVSAMFTLDGKELTSITNTVTGEIPDVTLELLNTTSQTVTLTVFRDPKNAADNVVKFASSYNDVIKEINSESIKRGPVQKNQRVQNFADSLIRESQTSIPDKPDPPRSLKDLELKVALGVGAAMASAITNSLEHSPSVDVFDTKRDPSGGIIARLSQLGILSQNDFTLSVKNDRLRSQLAENPKAVFDLFNEKPSGVGVRLLSKIDTAIGGSFNLIESETNQLNKFGKNRDPIARFMEARGSIQNISGLLKVVA